MARRITSALILILTLAVIGVGLSATNPDRAAFVRWASERAGRELAAELPGAPAAADSVAGDLLGGALQSMGEGLIAAVLEQVTDRRDYRIFSVYSLDLGTLVALGADLSPNPLFLGIAGQFIPLRGFRIGDRP